ncbi:hypothetical protein VCR6J2_240116 [Vibrio coralliirubri]|nr:hypothetical protein VCR6J2_240116 [Vibrio coralliirubri]
MRDNLRHLPHRIKQFAPSMLNKVTLPEEMLKSLKNPLLYLYSQIRFHYVESAALPSDKTVHRRQNYQWSLAGGLSNHHRT